MLLIQGDTHTAAISKQYELYTFGSGDYYKLGHGVCMDELIPKKVETLEDMYVFDVACGSTHTLCITNEGFVYSWGSGNFSGVILGNDGRLGILTQGEPEKLQVLPSRCGEASKTFTKKMPSEVFAGPSHNLCLTIDGFLFSWGLNKNSVLGLKLD